MYMHIPILIYVYIYIYVYDIYIYVFFKCFKFPQDPALSGVVESHIKLD